MGIEEKTHGLASGVLLRCTLDGDGGARMVPERGAGGADGGLAGRANAWPLVD